MRENEDENERHQLKRKLKGKVKHCYLDIKQHYFNILLQIIQKIPPLRQSI